MTILIFLSFFSVKLMFVIRTFTEYFVVILNLFNLRKLLGFSYNQAWGYFGNLEMWNI